MLVLNAFSLNMIDKLPVYVHIEELDLNEVIDILDEEGVDSAVGHEDTAALFTGILGITIERNRRFVGLKPGDRAVVGQYRGPRLREGETSLPVGASISWLSIEVEEVDEG